MGGKNSGKGTKPTDISKRFAPDFTKLDRRFTPVKALYEEFNALTTDLGGAAALSFQETTLCKRVVHLEALITKMETVLVKGGAIDVHVYLAAINTLASLLSKLGLRRRVKNITLSEYIVSKSASVPTPSPASPSEAITQKETTHGSESNDHRV